MGVPSFYRWLANRYPKIVVNAVENPQESHDAIDFHNLYLDMNGIIHPCFHPQQDHHQENSPVTYDEVFNNIFEYIDRIMNIVRPKKLLYMAIDGVAPRAKMNQQRSRRFRNAKDRQTLEEEEHRLRKQYEIEGKQVFPKVESDVADSNVITPGTDFMYELSKQLQAYIRRRVANHPAWTSLKVILSDASSPGEGEHKIMSFIRRQRTCDAYNPNMRHVLYGLDADLIMLALATHEIHFSILRENVLVEPTSATQTSKAKFDMSRGLEDAAEQISSLDISEVSKKKSLVKKPYQFLHDWILREYLKLDLKITETPENFVPDVERLIDDFIFICFFAGNDFLPHMPTLEIHEGSIDLLMHVYTDEFKNLGGYLVDVQRINDRKGCYIKLKRVEKFILAVGAYEDRIFKKRSAIHDSKLRRILSDIHAVEGQEDNDLSPVMRSGYDQKGPTMIEENTKMLKEQLKSYTRDASDLFKNGLVTDPVKFGSPGWKKRYYKCKFSAETEEDIEKIRKSVVEKYTQGLCWVLLYYFSDVPSWTWFYPYHYGPFASDLKGLSSVKVVFSKGLPFKPFDQLMAVLPPKSAHALPTPYQTLMIDEESSILDFYPSDFNTDTEGKRFLWQGVCKLPFIDEDRLLSATKEIEKELSADEAKRNMENHDQLYVHSSKAFASSIISFFNDVEFSKRNNSVKIDTSLSDSINGFVQPMPESMKHPDVLCVYYELPSFSVHIPRVLAGSTIPETHVSEADIEERQLWHDIYGYHNSRNNRSYNRTEGSSGNPSAGFRNSCPGVVIKGGGSGWNPRGRGKVNHFRHGSGNGSYHDTWSLNDQARGQSWWGNTHGRGSTNHPAKTNSSNGKFWPATSTDSSSSSYHKVNRWGETQSRQGSGDANVGSWRRSN